MDRLRDAMIAELDILISMAPIYERELARKTTALNQVPGPLSLRAWTEAYYNVITTEDKMEFITRMLSENDG